MITRPWRLRMRQTACWGPMWSMIADRPHRNGHKRPRCRFRVAVVSQFLDSRTEARVMSLVHQHYKTPIQRIPLERMEYGKD